MKNRSILHRRVFVMHFSLVEEFMLLANMAVAHRINSFYPDKALLRRHPPPQEKMLENLVGIPADVLVKIIYPKTSNCSVS